MKHPYHCHACSCPNVAEMLARITRLERVVLNFSDTEGWLPSSNAEDRKHRRENAPRIDAIRQDLAEIDRQRNNKEPT